MVASSTTTYGDESFLIATTNSGKRREFEVLLADLFDPAWKIYDCRSFPEPLLEVEETGKTFRENAVKKALELAAASGCCALADDSGLEVDALGGAPGVYSARFAGESATDEENNQLLVERLQGVPGEDRAARYVAVLCLALPKNQVARVLLDRLERTDEEVESGVPDRAGHLGGVDDSVVIWFRASVEGRIVSEPRGQGGFGYDPHFYVPTLGRTMAELALEEKNELSHRAAAVDKLLDRFRVGRRDH